MLFVAIGKQRKPAAEIFPRRLEWPGTEGIELVAEYWLDGGTTNLVVVFEANSAADILTFGASWDDAFELTISPAVTAAEGIELAKAMAGG
jgi:hypothetical protein